MRLARQMEALLSWLGVMFLSHTHTQTLARLCTGARTYRTYAVALLLECITLICRQTHVCHTHPTHMCMPTDRRIHTAASHPPMQALDVCRVCIFSHGIRWYSLSKPLASWCVQLHCRFISLPTQQSLI